MVCGIKKEKKDPVVSEIMEMEEVCYKITVVTQNQQGKWTIWEAVIDRIIMWANMWKLCQARVIS